MASGRRYEARLVGNDTRGHVAMSSCGGLFVVGVGGCGAATRVGLMRGVGAGQSGAVL